MTVMSVGVDSPRAVSFSFSALTKPRVNGRREADADANVLPYQSAKGPKCRM